MPTHSSLTRKVTALVLLAFLGLAPLALFVPHVSAQTQFVTVTPGYVNLGMAPSINITAPSASTYTVVVQKPTGSETSLNYSFTSAGQTEGQTYGNSSLGFKTAVDQAGTYNVFVESDGKVVGTTSFYATSKLVITMSMVAGGTCVYLQSAERGVKMIPKFTVTFASNGEPVTPSSDPSASVNFTLPSGAEAAAFWDSSADVWDSSVAPAWNFSGIGAWNPTAQASDKLGNSGNYTYEGIPYTFVPAQLSTGIQLVDAATGLNATTLSNGQTINIMATVQYPTNAEPAANFVGPLDTSRGGVVTALVGWGYYNATSGTFGGTHPGGLIATIPLTNSGSNGTWTGSFTAKSLPSESSYLVVVNSHDSATPANTGSATVSLLSSTGVTSSSSIPIWVYAVMFLLLIVGIYIGVTVPYRGRTRR